MALQSIPHIRRYLSLIYTHVVSAPDINSSELSSIKPDNIKLKLKFAREPLLFCAHCLGVAAMALQALPSVVSAPMIYRWE